MSKIKTREKVKDIKVLDKSAVVGRHMKNAFIRSKRSGAALMDDRQHSPNEYAEDKVQSAVDDFVYDTSNVAGSAAKSAMRRGRAQFKRRREKQRARDSRKRNTSAEGTHSVENHVRKTEQAASHPGYTARPGATGASQVKERTVKNAKQTEKVMRQAVRRTVKTAEHTSKVGVKTSGHMAMEAQKTMQAAAKVSATGVRAARAAEKAAATAKTGTKAVAATIKAMIASMKTLVAALTSGGCVAAFAVIVICLVGLLAGSCFGIFFSGEDSGTGQTMQTAVREISCDYEERLEGIRDSVPHDQLEMSGSCAPWPDILSVYAVRATTAPAEPQEVATMDNGKKALLTETYWAMNEIAYTTRMSVHFVTVEVDNGTGHMVEKTVPVATTTLCITISHRNAGEMADVYGFNAAQRAQLAELLAEENREMWNAVLYGVGVGSGEIVTVAASQIGNIGGRPYWSWYGFTARVDWCACFVSWCANECGYLDEGVLPRFSSCGLGVQWFKDRELWQERSYEPRPGDIVFFDWNGEDGQDGRPDHVGIVERAEGGRIYVVEGNSGDRCRLNSYSLGYYEIYGYGTPSYS